jgi:hypothetical protein
MSFSSPEAPPVANADVQDAPNSPQSKQR